MRHDKIVIVVLSYIIGFNAAFIAFGLETSDEYYADQFANVEIAASVISAMPATLAESTEPNQMSMSVVPTDGFYAYIDGQARALSAQATDETEGQTGYHSEIVLASVSPDETFIYFCAELRDGDDTCASFIYEVATDSVYRVKYGKHEQVISSIQTIDMSWEYDNRIRLDSYISVSILEPWRVVHN